MSVQSAFSSGKAALRRGAFGVAMAATLCGANAAYAQEATVRSVAVDVENIPVGEISASVRDPRITLDTDCKTWSAPNVPYMADTYCLIQQGYALKEHQGQLVAEGSGLDQQLMAAERLRACVDALVKIKTEHPERAAPYVGKVTRGNACEIAGKLIGPALVTGQASSALPANSLQ